ncbi:MAG: HAD family hydrolase [Acidobacteria bacterium]|nr:MAG: HAD family hydrolase [Acidobacteriota bacterium]
MVPAYPVYLFDIDGTLLDSARDICAAQMEVLSSAGCPPVTFEFLRDYIGLELRAVFSALLPGCSDTRMDELSQQYSALYRGRKHVETRVYPGVAEALAKLQGRKSTATTKSTGGTKMVLEHFGLLPYFDHIQGSDGIPCKPAPDVVLAAMKALGANPNECLLVGDSPADMEAGRRVGVKICAVTYGYGATAELEKWQPDHWISDLRQLLADKQAHPGHLV